MKKKASTDHVIENLESRVMLTSIPTVVDVHVDWTVSTANFKWHDTNPSDTTFVAEWSTQPSIWVEDSAHTLTGNPVLHETGNFEATQSLDAGQKYYYRVEAVLGGVHSGFTTPLSPHTPVDDAGKLGETRGN